MVLDANQLLFEYRNLKDPHHKILSLCQKGDLIPLKRGLYENDPSTPGYLLAYELTGPSYLSFEYALSVYGMIPERVVVYTSAICFTRSLRSVESKILKNIYLMECGWMKIYSWNWISIESNGSPRCITEQIWISL